MEENKNIPESEACKGACNENEAKKEKKSSKCKALEERIAALEAEIKEKDATYECAMADTVNELLPIIDNLERAAQVDAEGPVKDGLVMIMKSVEATLSKLGVEPVGKIGETFNPNLHNAVMHDEDETKGEGEIVEVYQKGYKKGNKIIRFAMVKTVN